ncbi:RHS repeat-associated core domain-containing protein [Flavobacterium branchiophilum]|uniref:RHS repeat-associated core domain-containing protein n=1 Tax=Flavobacterium branchiophilum TaxID=55197 RepID=UPI0002F77AC3|nr:RHS repeat-associated core domain-containing protein [Flavobacterium branchiophilum]
MHEWKGFVSKDPLSENLITWIFEEDSFSPIAKLRGNKKYSILADHLGTPIEAYADDGNLVWERSLNANGKVLKETGIQNFCPFLYQGQSYDSEIELAYNRFRYYDVEDGKYISQDPIGLMGGMIFYGYVDDVNTFIDVFGLSGNLASVITFTDSAGTTLTTNGYTDISHLTNTQLSQLEYMNTTGPGLSPKDKQGNVIVAHHYKQNPQGPIVMMPAKHHDKKHTNPGQHPNGKKKGGGLTDAERKAFNNWKKEYFAHLASEEKKRRKNKTYSKK